MAVSILNPHKTLSQRVPSKATSVSRVSDGPKRYKKAHKKVRSSVRIVSEIRKIIMLFRTAGRQQAGSLLTAVPLGVVVILGGGGREGS